MKALKLGNLLTKNGSFDKTIAEFNAKRNDSERVVFLEQLLKKHNLIPDFLTSKLKEKDSEKAEHCRSDGNKSYSKKKFLEALMFYNGR